MKIAHPLQPAVQTLTSYTGNTLPILGQINLTCSYKSKEIKTDFYIVNSKSPPLFGMQSCNDR